MTRIYQTYAPMKRDGFWWVIDSEGYEVSYVGYETKKEALEAARIAKEDDIRKAKFVDDVLR
jgi:hypothetical protein